MVTSINESELRSLILSALLNQGFNLDETYNLIITPSVDKNVIRSLHNKYRVDKLEHNRLFIQQNINQLIGFFADGSDIDIEKFDPILIPLDSNSEIILSKLFRLATLIWSIPVSGGFGRRVRFIILDKSNSKLVGVFALGDPIFNLRVRDQWIGWDHRQRASRLYNVMDLYILGAVPPYSNLLCGKLMAMIATSDLVQEYIFNKYERTKTTIRNELKDKPYLALITTTSALGRSSIYNRIKYKGNSLFDKIGYTEGWGHFHLGNSTFEAMRNFLREQENPIEKQNRFGQGPNWKMRTVRTCLSALGLSPNLLRHGIKREFYAAPLASNFQEYLLGHSNDLNFYDFRFQEIVTFFKNRWLYPRASRCPNYKKIKANDTLRELLKLSNG